MPSAAEKLMSVDEFLAWERDQPERYEYAGGVATMMTGASLANVTITMNLAFALRQGLRGTGCRSFANDAKTIANGSVRYPDIVVTCRPIDPSDDVVPEPVLVIEVISPGTEREDRGRKKFDYFATPSIRQYAIVEQDERRVDLYTRSGEGWTNRVVTGDTALDLSSVGVAIGLAAIYEDTELDPTRPPAGEAPAPAA
ncbi:MAG: Uma2 family endonuclease [Alphaproteobacteria bacterium]|nr:Uma2 family endonuclease [Alphaproteobacteria bacterium]